MLMMARGKLAVSYGGVVSLQWIYRLGMRPAHVGRETWSRD